MELNFKTFGQGEPIVILHGLFGTLDNWQTIARRLAGLYTVYIVDQRNHGRSPHSDTMDYPSMADDLRHFMESHWMFKATIMGHSMGGKTAMHFALHHPDMVDKLIVVDMSPKRYPGGHQEIFEALMAIDPGKIDTREEADELLQKKIEDYSIRQFLLKNLSRTKKGTFQWKMNLPALSKNYQKILAPTVADEPFEGETLFVRGGDSDYIQEDDLMDIYELFPQAQLETIAGAGHWVHSEAPEAFLEVVEGFVGGD